MTQTLNHLGESPRHQSRRPLGAHPNRPAGTLDRLGVHHPTIAKRSTPVTTTAPRAAATSKRRTSEHMLATICDPDRRATDRDLRVLAGGITAGQPMPDPEHSRGQFHAFLGAAGAYLDEQPSERTTRAAGLRMQRALIGLVNDVAGGKTC